MKIITERIKKLKVPRYKTSEVQVPFYDSHEREFLFFVIFFFNLDEVLGLGSSFFFLFLNSGNVNIILLR